MHPYEDCSGPNVELCNSTNQSKQGDNIPKPHAHPSHSGTARTIHLQTWIWPIPCLCGTWISCDTLKDHGTGDILLPEMVLLEEIKAVWIARNCSMHLEEYGEERWVVTKPFTIFSKQLTRFSHTQISRH